MELGVLEIFAELFAKLLHSVVFLVVMPINVDRCALGGGKIELVHQHHDRLSARAVEIDQLEIEAALSFAEIGEIGVERAEHRTVELGHVLRIGLAFDLELMLAEVEKHSRGAGRRRNFEVLHQSRPSQMVAFSAKNAWSRSMLVKSNSSGFDARRAISIKPRPAPLLPCSGSARNCSL